ncbi:MAG: hypothetical protein WCE64_10010, partial [Bacteroidales bacterium]
FETPKLGVSTNGSDINIPDAPRSGWKSNSIGSIINQYKRICTINIKKINPRFEWEPRFYDHIIRTHADLKRIRNYIKENPVHFE